MGYFRTEIKPNYENWERELREGNDSIRVTTTYTEEKGKEYPSIDALKKSITRGIFHTNIQLAGYNVLTVLTYAFLITGLTSRMLGENIPLSAAATMGFVGTAYFAGLRHASLESFKRRLTSQGYALWRFNNSSQPNYPYKELTSIINPDIKGFLSTFRKNP